MKPGAYASFVEPVELALPLARYRDAFPTRRGGFVLDGGDVTLLGAEPFLAFRAFRSPRRLPSGALGARVVIEEQGAVVRADVDDPLAVLRALMQRYATKGDPSGGAYGDALADASATQQMPAELTSLRAGAVGYIGYETGQMLERLPHLEREGLGMPDIAFFFHDWVVGRSRTTGQTWLSVVGRAATRDDARAEAARMRDRLRGVFAAFEQQEGERQRAAAHPGQPPRSARATSRVTRDDYLAKIAVARDHILTGDAFEICLTHRLDVPFAGDAFALWQDLVSASPAPYAAFLDLPEGAIASSSPERFLKLDAARVVESRPIKGTRPRGETPAHDATLAAELASSPKDRAENAMIVDLVRNDLGRVCGYGTVETPDLFAVESYATVHQLVSTVRGQLAAEHDAIDLVRACFPPGSMTGAPKIEAMTILEALEPTERGVYSGALGWLDFAGPMELSVVIRTIIVKDGRAHLDVGGAIVADSDAAAEHEETMHKARALLSALGASADAIDLGARP